MQNNKGTHRHPYLNIVLVIRLGISPLSAIILKVMELAHIRLCSMLCAP